MRPAPMVPIAAIAQVAGVVLLGFALRLFKLAHLGDLEFDEIVSVRYAALPLGELLPKLAGALFEHPPAFYAALGGWQALVGSDDVLARLFSVLPGSLSIPLTYAVGRRVYGHGAGLLAAGLVAVAPLTLFYSREARMYALVGCLALAALWLYLRGVDGRRGWRQWAAYGLIGAVTTYVHYLGALLILAQVVAAWLSRRRAPHLVRPVTLAGVAIVLVALPWALGASGSRASLPALTASNLAALPSALAAVVAALAAGPDATGTLAVLAGAALLVLAGLGMPVQPVARLVLVCTVAAGLVGVVFAVALGKPVQARYVVPIVPVVCLAAAGTVVRVLGSVRGTSAEVAVGDKPLPYGDIPKPVWTQDAAFAVGACCFAATLGFAGFWGSYFGGYVRADYGDVTREVAGLERPGDVVLLTGPWQAWYFDYYYPRSGGTLSHMVLPKDAPPALDAAEAIPQLEALSRANRRVWYVQAGLAQSDPTNLVERWLHERAWPAAREPHQNAVLSLFAFGEPERRRALSTVTYGEAVRLTGGWAEDAEVATGDVVKLSLTLEALRPLPQDLKASLRLVGADGQRTAVDFTLADRTSGEDVPTSRWTSGKSVVVRRGVLAPPSLGPQPYELRLVIYDPATLRPLTPATTGQVSAGGEAAIGDVYVTQSLAGSRQELEDRLGMAALFGGGDDFDAVAFRGARWVERDTTRAPLTLDLLWQVRGFSGTPHFSALSVVDTSGRVWAQETRPLFGGTFNVKDWRNGETLAERRALDLSALPLGRYDLTVGLRNVDGRALPVDGKPGTLRVATLTLPYRRPVGERVIGVLRRYVPVLR